MGEGGRLTLLFSSKEERVVEILGKLLSTFYVQLWRTNGSPEMLSVDVIREHLG